MTLSIAAGAERYTGKAAAIRSANDALREAKRPCATVKCDSQC